MMSKITSGKGPAGKSGTGKSGDAAGSTQFRSSVEQSKQAPEAKAVELQPRENPAPLPVDRDPPRKRRKPPVFETSHTVSLREALEIQGMTAALLSAQGRSVEEDPPGITVITRDGARSFNPPTEPLLAYQTIFMDGDQYETWRAGTAEPALSKAVGEMLSLFVSGSGKD
jgi:hypothetical protein